MRILITAILFILCSSAYLKGQSNFTGGFIAGGSLSQLTGDEAYGFNKCLCWLVSKRVINLKVG